MGVKMWFAYRITTPTTLTYSIILVLFYSGPGLFYYSGSILFWSRSILVHLAGSSTGSVTSPPDVTLCPSVSQGVCLLSGDEYTIHRRLDIRLVPHDQYYCAVLYFTGSDEFNRSVSPRIGKFGWETTPYGYYLSTLSL